MKTKKAYLMILMSALSLLNAYSQLPSYIPSNGLVGYWPFNGNANDESGNGNNGTVNGATLTANRNGVANKAYNLNGTSNYINLNITITSPFSVSIWVCVNNFKSYLSNTTGSIIIGNLNNLYLNTGFSIGLDGRPTNYGANGCSFWGQASNPNITSNNLFILNNWRNIICTYDGTTLKYYDNGQLIGSFIGTYNTNQSLLTIGAARLNYLGGNGPDLFLDGKVDDIGVWNRSLNQQEITALYNSCSYPTSTITPQGNTTFCQGGSVNLNASIGANYTYEWYNNGNIINNATSSIYNAATSGDYTVKVTDGACNTTSSVMAVTVNANPTVSLNTLNSVVFKTSLPIQLVGNPSGGTYSGDAVSGSTFTPVNATLGKKTISYNYTTQQGCSGSASQTTIVTDSVGNVCSTYDNLKIKVKFTAGLYANTINTIKFYPNPTKDVLFIDNGNYQAMIGYSIKIVSLAGTVVYNQPITSQQVQISMNQFATKGLYIAQIVDSNNTIVDSKKIVLE